MGTPPSSIPRLYKALNNYGFWPLFEAIVASSEKVFESDPLNYVIKVASNKWKEQEAIDEDDEDYASDIDAAKKRSEKENEALAKKLATLGKGSH